MIRVIRREEARILWNLPRRKNLLSLIIFSIKRELGEVIKMFYTFGEPLGKECCHMNFFRYGPNQMLIELDR
jgi:hypothetical protein